MRVVLPITYDSFNSHPNDELTITASYDTIFFRLPGALEHEIGVSRVKLLAVLHMLESLPAEED